MSIRSEEARLDQVFAALAHSTRRAMLARLAEGEATVNELAEPFQISLPVVSKHLKVLKEAGLVTQGQNAQYRPCRLNAAPLKEISTWTEHYRPIWEKRFERMDDYINQLNKKEQEDE